MNILILHSACDEKVCLFVNAEAISYFVGNEEGCSITLGKEVIFVKETPKDMLELLTGQVRSFDFEIHIPKEWKPKENEKYYTPIFSTEGFIPGEFIWHGDGFDVKNLSRGICEKEEDCKTLCNEMNRSVKEVLKKLEDK